MKHALVLSSVLAFLSLALPARAQVFAPAPVPSVSSSFGDRFGSDVADGGDIDGDGKRDLVVLSIAVSASSPDTVQVFSGADRTPLLAFELNVTDASDSVVRAAGDVDGDGFGDLVVGSPAHNGGTGRVTVYSCRSGAVLRAVDGPPGSRLGTSVAGLGDVDDDGFADFAAGAPFALSSGQTTGLARVYSGASGSVLYSRHGLAGARLGAALSSAGDLDADGFQELLIGAPGTSQRGIVYVDSPHTGALVRVHQGVLGSELGTAVAGLGDIDGDGRDDYAAGLPGADKLTGGFTFPDAGAVWCWSGESGAFLRELGPGLTSSERLGTRLAPGGDLDGDGVGDVLACGKYGAAFSGATGSALESAIVVSGTPSAAAVEDQNGDNRTECAFGSPTATWPGAQTAGAVLIYRMAPDTLLTTLTPISNQRFGSALAVLPDVNGDGLADTLVGSPFWKGQLAQAGTVALHSGADGAPLWAAVGFLGDQLASAVAPLGDVTGDGIADVLVGAPRARKTSTVRNGSVRILSGSDGSLWEVTDGTSAGERFGAAVAGLGDVSGDGLPDFAVGAPGAANASGKLDVGRVSAHSGVDGALLWSATPAGNARPVLFGSALASVGDVNGDGRADLLVGAPNGGGAFVRSGLDGSLLLALPAPSGASGIGARFGAAVAGCGDVDRDGVPDLLVGAPGYDGGKGAVWVHSGADGSVLHAVVGPSAGLENLGASVTGPGDVDNDGVPDFAAGAPLAPFLQHTPGLVHVYSGASGSAIRTWAGAPGASGSGERFGSSLASGGDIDGDGLSDLVAGAPFATSDPDREHNGRATVPSPRVLASEHYGTGRAGCVGPHLLALGSKAVPGGTLDLRVSALAPQATPVLLITFGAFDPGIPILGGLSLLVDITQPLYSAVLPSTSGHLATALPLPNNPAWHDLTLYAQLIQLWPGGCAALATPYSSTNGLELVVGP